MRTTQIFFVLGLLLPLCTVVTSFSIKYPTYHVQKAGRCPDERYYIKASNPEIIHKKCQDDSTCENNMKCCPDNKHMMCKPPAAVRPGQCATFEPTFTSTTRCNDNCTSDTECPENFKCCFKDCGKTCTATLSDLGKPSRELEASKRFCQQETVYNCVAGERTTCDESSCIDGYKCCPFICRIECRKSLPEKDGKCPANAACPAEAGSKSCSSDHDCTTLHKCCSTSCGQRCLLASNVTSNMFDPRNPNLRIG